MKSTIGKLLRGAVYAFVALNIITTLLMWNVYAKGIMVLQWDVTIISIVVKVIILFGVWKLADKLDPRPKQVGPKYDVSKPYEQQK